MAFRDQVGSEALNRLRCFGRFRPKTRSVPAVTPPS